MPPVYWAGEDSDAIVDLVQKFPEIASDPRFLAANAIRRDKNTLAQIETVLVALGSVEVEPSPNDSGESTDWRWFFERFLPKVSQAIESSNREKLDWKQLIERLAVILRHLDLSGKAYPTLGRLYYLVGDLDTAITHWKECPPTEKQDQEFLLRARAQKEPYPDNVIFFGSLDDHKTVLETWRSADSTISQETPINQILKSAIQVPDVDAIRDLLPVCDEISTILEAAQINKGEPFTELRGAFPVAIANWLEARGQWREIVNFAIGQKTPDGNLNAILKEDQWDLAVTIAATVRVLARSQRLAAEKAKSQQTISDFLKQYLIINNNSKNEKQAIMKETHELVSIKEVGAAFERAFRLTFALEYYEQWFAKHRLSPSPEDEKFARQRWLKCKYRLSEVEGSPRGDRHKNEAQQRERDWNLSIDTEPEYPNLGPVTALNIPASRKGQPTVEPLQPEPSQQDTPTPSGQTPKKESEAPTISANAQIVVDDLKLDVSILTNRRRILLTRENIQDQVSCGPQKVSSEDVRVKQIKDDESVKAWLIEEWKICCEIQFCNNTSIIRLRTKEDSPILGFEL